MSVPSAEPPTGIPEPPPIPSPSPQTFKCEKCGAAFDDEGAAAAHIQVCKGSAEILDDETVVVNPQDKVQDSRIVS